MDKRIWFYLTLIVFVLYLNWNGSESDKYRRTGVKESIQLRLEYCNMDERGRVKWTFQMLIDLLRCKKEA